MLPMQNYSGFFGASAMQQFVSTVPLVSAPIASGAVLSTSPTPAGSAASTPFPTPVPTPTANSVAKMGRTMFPGEAQFSTSEEVAETAVVKEAKHASPNPGHLGYQWGRDELLQHPQLTP